MLSPIEITIVVAVLALLVAGPKLLPKLGRSAAVAPAEAIRGYREGQEQLERGELEAELEADADGGEP